MSNGISKLLGEMEFHRCNREIQLLEFNAEFTEEDKRSIKKYLKWKKLEAEKLMNPPPKTKPHFNS